MIRHEAPPKSHDGRAILAHPAADRQFAEAIFGQPLVALEDRPAEQLKASAGYWDSEVENFRTVGGHQVTACPVDDQVECWVIGQGRQTCSEGRQCLVD
jgi:hypothetical protein